MLNYSLRCILSTIPVMVVVALFVLSLLYIAPGDPATVIAGDQASPADVARIRATLASINHFCRTPPVWALLRLPAQRFGASSLPWHKPDQDMNSPR
jgi:peptide/nickel transport system permease protein